MSMREKMARALARQHYRGYKDADDAYADERVCLDWKSGTNADWYAKADAALDALMEPTQKMRDAIPITCDAWDFDEIWPAVIAAAKAGA